MFNYGQIIEYIDGTYDENFDNAYQWCKDNNATFDELIEKRNDDKRYFQINEIKYEEVVVENKPLTIEEQNEAIRQTREELYYNISDKIKQDYDEAVARGAENAEQLKQEWLASKDKIREENPYIDIVD